MVDDYTITIEVDEPVTVRIVQVGERLEKNDLYKSSSGKFEPCPCPGVVYMGGTVFYRPVKDNG